MSRLTNCFFRDDIWDETSSSLRESSKRSACTTATGRKLQIGSLALQLPLDRQLMKPVRVKVNDKMQKGYVYWRTKPIGKSFRPGFKPQLTPKQMLELGVFGGKYMTDCRAEFPPSWFKKAKLSDDRARASLNYFGVNASQPLSIWREKGWIHKEDPRGWFQWYCRYYSGRRCPDDLRQIARWRAVRRHVAQLKKHCTPRDLKCRPRQRQALLHWAYDSRKI